ncbi:MAG TPA: ABC transporter permease [Saprospiraceae bacterium]|nr:ABC transporter permease [Saprospiraceae bacterium]
MLLFKAIYESIVQAVQELNSNKLRSFLSSLGITIGIFCIISVLSAVDSLERNISDSFEKLGNDVLYVDRQPWNEDPESNWWKYMRRPAPDYEDYEVLKANVKRAEFASLTIFIPGRTIEFGSSHVRGGYMAGLTYDYADISRLEFQDGRYFTPYEYETGANKVILGFSVADELFRSIDPIGKTVKMAGQKFQVIGVLKKEGNSLINIFQYDQAILISFHTAKKLVNVKTGSTWGTMLNVKARPGVELVDLRDEVTGVLRAHRKLKPKEESNFAINELSMFTNLLRPVFGMMNVVGFVIGLFAMIVGAFSVANIMFVSVKERTNIIGIKKALGAKRGIILLEFLIEAILLCIVGGLFGLGVVMLVLRFVSGVFHYEMFVSTGNIIAGLMGAIVIGVIAGIIPAMQAARMDPVEAIRK